MHNVIIKDFIEVKEMMSILVDFFNVNLNSIAYFDVEIGSQNEGILFEYNKLEGDFSFELWVYTKLVYSIEELSMVICKKFNTQTLISDNSDNPYIWVLYNESGKIGTVKQVAREDDIFQISIP
ncbi:hypothetical protein [Paraflavitalea pollutisoli]|uniref:hypothetical protein n=1 Tax=Paraflavitalea pollutisoli TaxID=3034143 RepID=UPI0023EB35E7|nr:hypothetical protein [Paraflavitalea sp. H1-2-19X]